MMTLTMINSAMEKPKPNNGLGALIDDALVGSMLKLELISPAWMGMVIPVITAATTSMLIKKMGVGLLK